MGQDRNRNPASAQAANSLQTALESCHVSSALLYPLLLENLIHLHPVVQSSAAAALSAFKFLLADLMCEMLSHKVLCPGLALQSPPLH